MWSPHFYPKQEWRWFTKWLTPRNAVSEDPCWFLMDISSQEIAGCVPIGTSLSVSTERFSLTSEIGRWISLRPIHGLQEVLHFLSMYVISNWSKVDLSEMDIPRDQPPFLGFRVYCNIVAVNEIQQTHACFNGWWWMTANYCVHDMSSSAALTYKRSDRRSVNHFLLHWAMIRVIKTNWYNWTLF